MCWNADISIKTFLVGIVGIALGVHMGTSLPVLLFFSTIICVQLIEAVVWTWYDNETVNRNASYAACALLWLQPIAAILLLPSFMLKATMILIYSALSFLGFFYLQEFDFSMKRASNGHLAWNFLRKDLMSLIVLIIYFIFLFTPIFLTGNIDLFLLGIGTLGISFYSFWQENTWGSLWCWIGNGLVLVALGKKAFGSLKYG